MEKQFREGGNGDDFDAGNKFSLGVVVAREKNLFEF